MTVEELIQLMRTCSLARVREQLEKAHAKDQVFFEKLVSLYQRAAAKSGN